MSEVARQNRVKYFLIIVGCFVTFLVCNPSFADELVLEETDRFVSAKLDNRISNTKDLSNELQKPVAVEKEESVESHDKYEPVDYELLTLNPKKYSFSLNSSEYDHLNLPGSVIDFGSGVYIGSPIFSLNKESLYKGASEEDLESSIGAAVKLVILNK